MTRKIVLFCICLLLLAGCNSSLAGLAPSSTPSVVPTRTPIVPPTSTTTPTAIFTLSPQQQEQQHAAIVGLIEDRGGCELPCFWGITPGETSLEQAGQSLMSRGIFLDATYTRELWASDGWVAYHAGEYYRLETGAELIVESDFFSRGGTLGFIRVEAGAMPPFEISSAVPEFAELWTDFAPERIIPALGVPSRVKVELLSVAVAGYGGPGALLGLDVFYDDRGIMLGYNLLDNQGSVYAFCPTFGEGGNTTEYVIMMLKSPDDPTALEYYYRAGNPDGSLDIREAAGLTVVDFYNLFIQNGQPPCFQVPDSAFGQ
jgi:hypothetical protein